MDRIDVSNRGIPLFQLGYVNTINRRAPGKHDKPVNRAGAVLTKDDLAKHSDWRWTA